MLDVTRLIWRRWRGRRPTGIDRVCLAYLNCFQDQAHAVVQYRGIRRILDQRASAALFELLAEGSSDFRRKFLGAALQFGFQRGCEGSGRIYLNVGHTGLHDPGFRAWVLESNVKPVYLVHDLIPVTHPEYCRAGEREKHMERMRTVLATAAGVIGNSRATLEELDAFAGSERLPFPPSIAALLGSSSLLGSTPDSGGAERPTFVMLGTIEPRKNHLMILQVWSRLVSRLGKDAPQLLILGQRGWECEQVCDVLDRSQILNDAVIEIGECDDESLARYLGQARALLFPSFAEGYGLPLIEALKAETPVVASDLPVFREVAGDVPDYLDPLDAPAWEHAILEYATDASTTRSRQLHRLQTYVAPTWEGHFESVKSWLAAL